MTEESQLNFFADRAKLIRAVALDANVLAEVKVCKLLHYFCRLRAALRLKD